MGRRTRWLLLAILLLTVAADSAYQYDYWNEDECNLSTRTRTSKSSTIRKGKGDPWYRRDYELEYVEAWAALALMMVSLLFEVALHKVTHRTDHSYKYGEDPHEHAKASHGIVNHERLASMFVARCAEEFSVLGFLAFCVFLFSRSGGFDALARRIKSEDEVHADYHYDQDWQYPKSGMDWLHVVEDAHMTVFGMMIIYFIIEAAIVYGSIKRIYLWEQLHARRHEPTQDSDKELSLYISWRKYFILSICLCHRSHPNLVSTIFSRLRIDDKVPNAIARLQQELESKLLFSEYLALNVEVGIYDTIAVAVSSRSIVMGLCAIVALTQKYGHVDPDYAYAFLVFCCLTAPFVMKMVVRRGRNEIPVMIQSLQDRYEESCNCASSSRSSQPEHAAQQDDMTFKQNYKFERIFLRGCQAGAMCIGYPMARVIFRFEDWKADPLESFIFLVAYMVLVAVIIFNAYDTVPEFLGVTALPPYVDDGNTKLLILVLDAQRSGKTPSAFGGRSIPMDKE